MSQSTYRSGPVAPADIITYRHHDKLVYVKPAKSYELALDIAQKEFPEDLAHIPRDRIGFAVLSTFGGGEKRPVRISESAWSGAVVRLRGGDIIDVYIREGPQSKEFKDVPPPQSARGGDKVMNSQTASVASAAPLKDNSLRNKTLGGSPGPIHHAKYYFDDVPVIFKVENCLFKVHRHFLKQESSVFQTMFSCPPTLEGPEGQTEDRPIVLPGVKVEEFEALLDFLYEGANKIPSSWTANPTKVDKDTFFPNFNTPPLFASHDPALIARLTSLLSIATRFDFEKIRTVAIDALEKRLTGVHPVDKIVLAREYDVERWLKPAYIQLCKRREPLEVEEGEKLGMRTTILIAKAREAFHGSRDSPSAHGVALVAERIVSGLFFPGENDVDNAGYIRVQRRTDSTVFASY